MTISNRHLLAFVTLFISLNMRLCRKWVAQGSPGGQIGEMRILVSSPARLLVHLSQPFRDQNILGCGTLDYAICKVIPTGVLELICRSGLFAHSGAG